MKKSYLKPFFVFIFLIVPMFLSSNVRVYAATSSTYQPGSMQELIAYLYGVIASLEAQLGVSRGGTTGGGVVSSTRASVTTVGVSGIDRDEATVRGSVQFGTATYLNVSVEYGTNDRLTSVTNSKRVNKGTTNVTFNLDSLRSNTKYYYRFVAELPNGSEVYGTTRTFTTERSGSSSGSSNNSGDSELSVDESSYRNNENITVEYDSDEINSGAWIGLYREGSSNQVYTSWQYVVGDSSDLTFIAPSVDGEYEFRLFSDSGYNLIATSDSFEIE